MSYRKSKTLLSVKTAAAAIAILLFIQLFAPCSMQASAASEYVVIITASSMNVRSGAGTGNGQIGLAYLGTSYDYLGESKDSSGSTWYKIQYSSSKTGWVSSKYALKTKRTYDYTQEVISHISKSYGAVGVQVAVIKKGAVTNTYNYGWAIKNATPMTSEHKIRVASISKVAVAINAMKMQEQGVVDIGANIGKYWGSNPYKAVTLKSLLTHTSTLKSLGYSSTRSGTLSQLRTSDSYNRGTVGNSSTWGYNNYAVGVAGSTLEVASGQTLESYAKKHIFKPLGIDAAFSSGLLDDTSKIATLYHSNGNVARSISSSMNFKGSTTPGSNTAVFAGGLTCSAHDLAVMMAMLANDGKYNGKQILKASSVEAIEKRLFVASEYSGTFYQCMPLRYKSGLYGESGLYYHTGNAYGVLALASYNPDTRDGVVVLTTGMSDYNTSPACARDAQGIYEICGKLTEYIYKYHNHRQSGATTTAKKTTTTTTTASTTTSTTTSTTAPTTSPNVYMPAVKRLAGKSRYFTAAEIAKEYAYVAGTKNSDAVIIANGQNYADALAGVPLSAFLDAPILLTANLGGLESAVIEQISSLNAKNVFILGGSSVVSDEIYQNLEDMGLSVTRLYGSSRYETAVDIAQYNIDKGCTSKTVFVVSGENFPDALSAGVAAGIMGANILFCPQSGEIRSSVADFITQNGIDNAVIVGGTGAVGEQAEAELAALGVKTKRVCGGTRYETALAVFKEYADIFDPSTLTFATGENFPDALAGGALSATLKAPVILVNNRDDSAITRAINPNEIERVYIYGGESVVSPSTVEKIFS